MIATELTELLKDPDIQEADRQTILRSLRTLADKGDLTARLALDNPSPSLRGNLRNLSFAALDSLGRLNPTRRFLADLIRGTDTPSRLRLAATQLLDEIRTAGLGEAEARTVASRTDGQGSPRQNEGPARHLMAPIRKQVNDKRGVQFTRFSADQGKFQQRASC